MNEWILTDIQKNLQFLKFSSEESKILVARMHQTACMSGCRKIRLHYLKSTIWSVRRVPAGVSRASGWAPRAL